MPSPLAMTSRSSSPSPSSTLAPQGRSREIEAHAFVRGPRRDDSSSLAPTRPRKRRCTGTRTEGDGSLRSVP